MSPERCEKPLPRRSISQERVENVSDIIGSWGPLQTRLLTILTLIYCASPFNNASLFYYVLKSDLWCEQADGTKISISSETCSLSQLSECVAWGHNITRNTITKEWNLVCERYWLRSVALSAYQVGYLFSGLIVGYISDKFGRRFAIIFCIILEIFCGFSLYFSASVYMFIGLRVFHGIGGFGRYLASLILLLESVGPKIRGRIIVGYDWVWFAIDYVMILIVYFVPTFRYIYLGSTVYQIFTLILVLTQLPESPRWQLIYGKSEQAEATLRKYAVDTGRINEAVFTAKMAKLRGYLAPEEGQENTPKMGIFDLWRQPKLLKYCLTLYLLWYLRSFIGYGMHYTTLDLAGSVFLNNAIFGLAGMASLGFLTWKVERFPRRTMLIVFFILTAIMLFATIPVLESPDHMVLRTIILTVGRFFPSTLFSLLYVYSPEVFPTSIRHLGVGTCSVASRIATTSAPFVAQLTSSASLQMTYALFATISLIGAAASFFLPETKGKEIPDTVEDMIEMNLEVET